MEEKPLFKKNIGKLMLGMAVFIFVTQYVWGMLLVQLLFKNFTQNGSLLLIISFVGNYLIGLPIFWLIIKKMPKYKPNIEVEKPTGKKVFRWICISLALMIIFNFVTLFITQTISLIKGAPVINPLENIVMGSNIIITALFGAIIGPIMEEFVFRKMFYDRISQYGDKFYIIISAFCFAMFHVNLPQIIYAFALGAFFAYIYSKTQNIKYTILLHIIVNSWGLVASQFLLKNPIIMVIGVVFLYTLVIMGIVFIIKDRKKHIYNGAVEELPEKPVKTALLTPGSIVYIVLCIIIIILLLMV